MNRNKELTQDEVTKLLILGAIAELPTEQQQQVNECAMSLRELIKKYDTLGRLAYALVGAELQME